MKSKFFYANLALCVIAVVLFVWSVGLTNHLVSSRYANNVKQTELNRLGSDFAMREASLGNGNDLVNLLSLVKRNGMVYEKEGQSLFIASGVAYSNGAAPKQN